jgi:high-affinity Fe2+/Pb2+ permease
VPVTGRFGTFVPDARVGLEEKLSHPGLWHSASLLSQDSAFGDVLHSFFGYSDAPTPLQLLVYVGYLAVVIAVYLGIRVRLGARASRPHVTA